jgi:phage terminase small subunit
MALTMKMQAFVEAYCGNATEAALKAGYSPMSAYSQGQRLLKNVEVKAAIAARQAPSSAARIADRQERQSFWTHVMRDPDEDMRNRLRAAELLGKSECDFAERVEVSGEMDIGILFDPEKRRRVLERIKS